MNKKINCESAFNILKQRQNEISRFMHFKIYSVTFVLAVMYVLEHYAF
jgi:hypothetical protein